MHLVNDCTRKPTEKILFSGNCWHKCARTGAGDKIVATLFQGQRAMCRTQGKWDSLNIAQPSPVHQQQPPHRTKMSDGLNNDNAPAIRKKAELSPLHAFCASATLLLCYLSIQNAFHVFFSFLSAIFSVCVYVDVYCFVLNTFAFCTVLFHVFFWISLLLNYLLYFYYCHRVSISMYNFSFPSECPYPTRAQ